MCAKPEEPSTRDKEQEKDGQNPKPWEDRLDEALADSFPASDPPSHSMPGASSTKDKKEET
jgi:hypothetical protein